MVSSDGLCTLLGEPQRSLVMQDPHSAAMQSYGKQYRPGYILTPIAITTDKKSVLGEGREKFAMKRGAAVQRKGGTSTVYAYVLM
jgi:hypothetical protein